jgi:hypothetical protein
LDDVKPYIHARLSPEDRAILDQLKRESGYTESQILRRGLRLVSEELRARPSALDVAGRSVGKFKRGPKDLATNRKHLEGFGE